MEATRSQPVQPVSRSAARRRRKRRHQNDSNTNSAEQGQGSSFSEVFCSYDERSLAPPAVPHSSTAVAADPHVAPPQPATTVLLLKHFLFLCLRLIVVQCSVFSM